MTDTQIIDLTPETIADYGVCGYKDVKKHLELRRKIDWFKQYYPKGLRIKALISKKAGYQGMLEYIPGKYAHRPVYADGYMFIHCIFTGFKKEFKGKGFGSALIDECIKEAITTSMKGVAVVVREGSSMAGKKIFLKKGFKPVDACEPDFEMLVLKFDKKAADPKFKTSSFKNIKDYSKGLTIFRSAQCPYSVKNVEAIMETARKKLKLTAKLMELKDPVAAQQTPCAFGTFCIVHNGEVVSHHPISNTRFENIMKKGLK